MAKVVLEKKLRDVQHLVVITDKFKNEFALHEKGRSTPGGDYR